MRSGRAESVFSVTRNGIIEVIGGCSVGMPYIQIINVKSIYKLRQFVSCIFLVFFVTIKNIRKENQQVLVLLA